MHELEFWSKDRKYGLRLGVAQTSALREACAAAGPNETGGLLIGTYNEILDCAVVTRVCRPAPDSRAGFTWFYRGTRGVQILLDSYWRRRAGFYLGEWHFHPHAAPSPSDVDNGSMRGISQSLLYNCPEPVLLIVGGNPKGAWSAAAFVFPREANPVSLGVIS
jgi:integrative and conjugative element protein (TIGR02256 family)